MDSLVLVLRRMVCLFFKVLCKNYAISAEAFFMAAIVCLDVYAVYTYIWLGVDILWLVE